MIFKKASVAAVIAVVSIVFVLGALWTIPRVNSVVVSLSDIASHLLRLSRAEYKTVVNVPEYPVPVIRASELSPGQVLVTGIKGRARVGPYPVQVLANVPWATEMRLGNTRDELNLTDWLPYRAESFWMVPTGLNARQVWAEFRDGSKAFLTSALVPDNTDLKSEYLFPFVAGNLFDPYTDDKLIWRQDFAENNGRWVSYDYNGGVHGNGNVFYPASWSTDGYLWTDNSRWRVDTPETPESILALLVYPDWIAGHPGARSVDMAKSSVEISLRGYDLDLKGASAHFYINTGKGRWYMSAPLTIGNDSWVINRFDTASIQWIQSWSIGEPDGKDVDVTNVLQFGIKFIGFPTGIEPTGILAMDKVEIIRDD